EREQEFFDAVLDQIREHGYDAVTMEGVAASTRCSKSTLYRQWGTKPRFVAAALRSSPRARFAGIDTGSLAADLRAAARPAGARALREALVDPEIASLEEILRRGVERGEVAAGHPALPHVPAQIFGVLRARPVLEGRNADPEYVLAFVEAAVLPLLTPPGPGTPSTG